MTPHLTAPPGRAQQSARPAADTGADVILRVLEELGVDTCFGMPGGAILPVYDAIARGTTIRHVLARHEQGAGHMAEAHARAGGRPGVVLATSGPGATNLVTPIANARMDSTPLLCITGQVRSSVLGTDAFQECDITGVTQPLVKRSWLVDDVQALPAILRDAHRLAGEGRPGPVLVDVPRDIQEARFRGPVPARRMPPAPWRMTVAAPPERLVRSAAALIETARAPVLYVGGGAVAAEAAPAVRALAQAAQIPVVATLMGKGVMPESDPLFCGWPGMHGTRYANLALNRADLVIAAGARFDDRVTGRLDAFAPDAQVIHLDADPRELGKLRRPDVALLAPMRETLQRLVDALRRPPDTAAWREQIARWRDAHPLAYDRDAAELKPQAVLEALDARLAGQDVIWTTGVGQHQMWAMQYLACEAPRRFLTSGGHGTMGFGLPAALGAKAARPDCTVVCVDGDGSFQMTLQELATSVAEDLPVIVVVLNNATLGMVRQWQSMFYDGRLSQVDVTPEGIDFVAIARGFGARGATVAGAAQFAQALEEALVSPVTTVIDVRVTTDERCYPMIAPGAAATEMIEYSPADALADDARRPGS